MWTIANKAHLGHITDFELGSLPPFVEKTLSSADKFIPEITVFVSRSPGEVNYDFSGFALKSIDDLSELWDLSQDLETIVKDLVPDLRGGFFVDFIDTLGMVVFEIESPYMKLGEYIKKERRRTPLYPTNYIPGEEEWVYLKYKFRVVFCVVGSEDEKKVVVALFLNDEDPLRVSFLERRFPRNLSEANLFMLGTAYEFLKEYLELYKNSRGSPSPKVFFRKQRGVLVR